MSAGSPIDPDLFRQILRHFAAGVTVITSLGDDGRPAGMTATAFSSVSIEPPQVLVCVNAEARTRRAIEDHAGFAVNILSAEQEQLAMRFASKVTDKFEGIVWRGGVTGSPLLEGAVAALECRIANAVEAGTHVIYIGEVLGGNVAPGEPLVYFDAAYRRLGPLG